MRTEAEWETYRQQLGAQAASVIPGYAFNRGQWILDRSDVIEAAQCVIRAIGPHGCGFVEWLVYERYGLWISTELANTNPFAAAFYVKHWGFYMRLYYWDTPPWGYKVRKCGGGKAAGRILGDIKPDPPRRLDPSRLP